MNALGLTIRREVGLTPDATVAASVYEHGVDDRTLQLAFYTGAAQISFAGLRRDHVEALRDALNVLLVETAP